YEADAKLLPEVLPVLLAALKEKPDQAGVTAAAAALARIGPDAKDAIPLLIALLQRTETRNYAYAIGGALAQLGPDAVPPLLALLKDPDPALRGQVQSIV